MQTVTNEAAGAVLVIKAVADAIRDLGSIPSGHLYAQLMGHMSLDQYQQIIGILTRTGLIVESGHVLTWKGV